MKAAVLYEANTPLQIVDLEQQGPQAGEARVRVKAAGVCHSDWHIMNGDWQLPLPMVLGHEAAGIVEEVGAGVANVKPGDHIIFSFRPQCGRCLYCSLGRSILCDGHKSARWAMLAACRRAWAPSPRARRSRRAPRSSSSAAAASGSTSSRARGWPAPGRSWPATFSTASSATRRSSARPTRSTGSRTISSSACAS